MSALNLVVFENDGYKKRSSDGQTVDFLGIRIGASTLSVTETSGEFELGAVKVRSTGVPTLDSHLVNKAYADSIAAGFDPKAEVACATTANLSVTAAGSGVGKTLTATANGAFTSDGVTPPVNSRILVKNQSTGANNGIYKLTTAGDGGTAYVLTRATDFDGSPSAEVSTGALTLVIGGTVHAGQQWYVTTADPITVDTTAITFSQASAAASITASAGLQKVGNDIQTKLEASNPTLEVISTELKVKYDGEGITQGANGLALELDGSTLSKSATGVKVAALGITSAELAASAVTTAKILDANVTDTKLASDSVTTAKILNANVTLAKLASLSVDESKLTTSVAGNGLTGGAGTALAVGAGESIKVAADSVAVDHAKTFTNDNAGTVTVRQVVYVKANGNIDLARADVAALYNFELGLVEDASITTTSSGKITVRRGAIVGGFTGLTPGKKQYVSRATAGALVESSTGFVAGEQLYQVGRAISATEVLFDPMHIIEM